MPSIPYRNLLKNYLFTLITIDIFCVLMLLQMRPCKWKLFMGVLFTCWSLTGKSGKKLKSHPEIICVVLSKATKWIKSVSMNVFLLATITQTKTVDLCFCTNLKQDKTKKNVTGVSDVELVRSCLYEFCLIKLVATDLKITQQLN